MSQISLQISQLFAAGRFAEAEKLCLSAAATSPGDSMVLAMRGAIKLELGEIKAAIAFLSTAISIDSRNAMAHFNLGVAHKKLMQFERAMVSFRTALGLAGPKPVILTAMGLTELERGRSAEAALILEQAARKDARSPLAFLNWGEALKASGQRDKAIEAFNRALSLKPDHVDVFNSLGSVYAELGNPVEAERHFRRALSINPRHAMARNNLGVLLKNQGKLAEALSEFEGANAADANYAMAFFNAGNVLEELRRPEAALKALQRAVTLRPNLAEAYLLIGRIHFGDDSFRDAEAALMRAIEIKPNYVDAHVALGALHRKLRNWKEARTAYDRALALDVQHFEALLGLGQTFSGQGIFAAADECFRRALEQRPDAPAARLALAKALFDQNKLDEAETCCRALVAELLTAEASLTYADVLVKQRRTEESISAYQRAIELMPSNLGSYLKLGEALQKLGRDKEVSELVGRLAALTENSKNDFFRIKTFSTIAQISNDLAPYETSLDLALATGRIADVGFYPVFRPTMRILPEGAASLLHKLNRMEGSITRSQRSEFHRARSLLLHETKSYQKAWQDLAFANRLTLEASEIEPNQRDDRAAQLAEVRIMLDNREQSVSLSELLPVFILGVSRSGKSTLENFLGLAEGWTTLDEYTVVEETFREAKITREAFQSGLTPEQRQEFAVLFHKRCGRYADRGPISFTAPGQLRYVKLLAEVLPGARFIFVRRDKMDTTFRCLQKLYRRGNYYSYDVRECVSYVGWYEQMIVALAEKLGERAQVVTYEDLVRDAPVVVSALWQWLVVKPARKPSFEIFSDAGCAEPYHDLIAAELTQKN